MTEPNCERRSGTTWSLLAAAVLVFAVVFQVGRWAGWDVHLSPDAVEYLAIAQSLRDGHGPLLPIKYHFFTPEAPPLVAVGERPLLYPMILWLTGLASLPAHWVNLSLGAGLALMLFSLAGRTGGPRVAWSALVLVLAYPSFWNSAIHAWPETTYQFFLVAGAWTLTLDRSGRQAWSGALFGCATLARPEGLGVGVAVLAVLLARRSRGVLPWAGAFVAVMLPHWVACWMLRGNPFYVMQGHHWRVMSFGDGMDRWDGLPIPSALTFLSGHAGEVARAVLKMEFDGMVLLVCLHLGLLTLGLLLLFWKRTPLPDSFYVLVAAAAVQQAGTHLMWSATAPYDAKYYVPTVVLLMVPALHGLDRAFSRDRARTVALATVVLLTLGIQFTRWPDHIHTWSDSDGRAGALQLKLRSTTGLAWLIENTGTGGCIAAAEPYTVFWATQRPTLMLPRLRADRFDGFLTDYDVRFLTFYAAPEKQRAFETFAATHPRLVPVADGVWYVKADH